MNKYYKLSILGKFLAISMFVLLQIGLAHAVPGRKEFIVQDKDGYNLHYIAYDRKTMFVLKKTRKTAFGHQEIMCGNTPMVDDVAIWSNKTVSFRDPNYAFFDGYRYFYETKKTDMTLYKDTCLGKR